MCAIKCGRSPELKGFQCELDVDVGKRSAKINSTEHRASESSDDDVTLRYVTCGNPLHGAAEEDDGPIQTRRTDRPTETDPATVSGMVVPARFDTVGTEIGLPGSGISYTVIVRQ